MTRDQYGKAFEMGYDKTLRFLLSRGAKVQDAHDCSQGAWARGWERLGQLRSEAMVVLWVNTIALNLFRRHIRRQDLLPIADIDPEHILIEPPVHPRPAIIDVDRLLALCTVKNRQLLEAHMRDVTTEEAARSLDISETAVRIRLLRARRAARQAVEQRALINRQKTAVVRIKGQF